ncbi:hypothetical protein CN445_29200 [Bacillus cereus]|uniref:hypothetical protein n=1 Tax=Bacillus nitratireducens TaxID=2026193 RepID=UPI0001A11350|nr:hypothetical protein [Bacillus nitratireducens]EEL92999.1 hypothetical protein bcere0030_29530 [Bacillus cereus AH1273]PEB77977.1 hypothetical protein COM95_29510 [Bacillus cereus]PEW81627.1 hypothetical protein CN445_29200 [Bacillus cereus]PFH63519.1 hypothetical protein COI61_31250 [Bacillus cereus]PFN70305.1 hypothetical protein COJ62_21440 [Bacillus cereus]
MEKETLLKNVKSLLKMHSEGFLGGEVMPEDVLIHVVPDHKLMDVLTLAMALNYQRNSYTLWEAVVKAYQDEATKWIFSPNVAANSEIDILRNALLLHRVALQPNRHPEIWKRVAIGIVQSSPKGNVQGLIESVQFDISSLKKIMQGTRKSDFPYLSGPKIFNYWLYVLESYSNVSWKSRELITIAPDTHILKATVKLGLCSSEVLNGTAENRQTVAKVWENVLMGSEIPPIDIHTPLWLWSRAGFPPLLNLESLKST